MDRLEDHLLEEAKYSLHDQHLGKTLPLKKVIDLKFAFFFSGVLPCEDRKDGLYPNVDLSIWLRSCFEEVNKPLKGKLTSPIPSWIKGSLLMNGPGKFYFGQAM